MEENLGQQYALQVAVQTMKERCIQLQQRLSIVEEENMNLRVKHHIDGLQLSEKASNSEVEDLHQKIAQLTKQKSQLTHNVLMVATENRHLWSRLSKLTHANQTLNDHLIKINDTLNQNMQEPVMPTQSTLIRSKTFTHETPPKIVKKTEDNIYTDTSLEDISLKIINSIAQEKYELEKQYAEMVEIQNSASVMTNSIGFAYPCDEIDDNAVREITQNMEKLIYMKDALLEQQEKLRSGYELLKNITEGGGLCKSCQNQKKQEAELRNSKKTSIDRLDAEIKPTNIHNKPTSSVENEKICPICNKLFIKEHVSELVQHVENHFIGEEEILDHFEVVPNYVVKK